MFDSQHWAEARGIAQRCTDIAKLGRGDSVLDVCCGPGRISVELALCGMEVTGVDITQPFLDAAAETAEDENVSLNLINADMRKFSSRKKFDAAVNIYNSFGYCDSVSDDTLILKKVAAALKKGGTFILECILIDSDGKRMEHVFVQRLYSAAELRDTMLHCGFSEVAVYGGFDLSAYDQNAKTMVIVAKK